MLSVVSANALRRMRAAADRGIRALTDLDLVPCHIICIERRGADSVSRCFVEPTHITPAIARRCLLQCANDAIERCAIERATMPPPPITAMVLGDLRMAVCAAHRPRRPISGHSLWGVSRTDIGSGGGGLFAHFSAPSDMDFTPLLAHALQCEGVSPLRFEVILEAHHFQTDDAAAEPLWTTGKGQCPERFTFYRMRHTYLKATG
jgi:hypothetical protein